MGFRVQGACEDPLSVLRPSGSFSRNALENLRVLNSALSRASGTFGGHPLFRGPWVANTGRRFLPTNI